MDLLMDLIGRLRHGPSEVDRDALLDEMMQEPDFARVRDVHHEALSALTAKRGADGLAIRREREFWERSGGHPQ